MAGRTLNFNQYQPNAPAYAGGPALRRAPAMPVGRAFAGGRPGPRVPGVARVPMLPTGGALGPAAENIVTEAIAEIKARGGELSESEVSREMAEILFNLQNMQRPRDETLASPYPVEGAPETKGLAPLPAESFDPRREMAENLFNLQNMQRARDPGAAAVPAAAGDPALKGLAPVADVPRSRALDVDPSESAFDHSRPSTPYTAMEGPPAGALAPIQRGALDVDPSERIFDDAMRPRTADNLSFWDQIKSGVAGMGENRDRILAEMGLKGAAPGALAPVDATLADRGIRSPGPSVHPAPAPVLAPTVPQAPAPVAPAAPATTVTQAAAPTVPQADVRLAGAPPPPLMDVTPAPEGLPDIGEQPAVEPVASLADPSKTAPKGSITASTGGVIQALLKENRVSAAAAKKLDKQDMGMGLLMAGLSALGRPAKIGDNAFTGIATGVQTGINYALSQKASRARKADKNFDKRLKVAGLYKDLSVAEAKLQAASYDKSMTRAELRRNHKALEGLKGDMIAVRQEANRLTSERNRTKINLGGADALKDVEEMISEDLAGQLNRRDLVQSLVIDAHPGSAAAAKVQRSNYARAVAAIDGNPRLSAPQKKQRKAEAKKRIGGWLKDWGHKGI